YEATVKNTLPVNKTAAREQLCERLRELAEAHGFTYNRVFIRNQRTRWGSCSYKNNISLNMKLVTLPEELRDYVIIHELVHTQEKNHGRPFWNELNRLVGNRKKMQAKLRTYGLGLP
ncbi:M48 family metallopeptidase, partial [Chloroflexota bacterium]